MIRQPRNTIAALTVLLLGGCSGGLSGAAAEPAGIEFEATEARLGSVISGTRRPVGFSFRVGRSAVTIRSLEGTCGCVEPRIEVAGGAVPAGTVLAPGTAGQVVVDFVTTGFKGPKDASVHLRGDGPGLPVTLVLRADLIPWCRIEPEVLRLGVLDGREARSGEVVVTADEPFLLRDPLLFPRPLQVKGLPSRSSARRQVFTVRVPADADASEGRQTRFLRVPADNGYQLQVPVVFEVARPLYVIPDSRLLLGVVQPGVEYQTTVELGAREGRLEPPEARMEGFGGARLETVTLEEGVRYRIRITLPDDLEPGPRAGELRLLLRHTVDGAEREVEKTLQVVGLIQGREETDPER